MAPAWPEDLQPVQHAARFMTERARPLAVTEGRLRERDAGQCDGGAALVGFLPQVCGRPEAFPSSSGIAAAAEQVPALRQDVCLARTVP